MKLPPINFTVLDTETTGFIPRVNRVIEFASVRVENGKEVDTYEQLIEIPDQIPVVIQVLTRIRPAAMQGCKDMDAHHDEIMKHIGEDTLIVGQNVGFDIRMLKGEKIDLSERAWIDTSMIASLVFPELASYSLGYVSKVLELNHAPVHRALGDVRATLELLSKCWERLLELPPDLLEIAQTIMSKSSPGYKMLFEALPKASKTKAPKWLAVPSLNRGKSFDQYVSIPLPEKGGVDLIEESLEPDLLQMIVNGSVNDTKTTHWIAVKNLEATSRRLSIPEGVRVLYPPFLLADPKAVATLAKQKEYTADEATLALKLAWYEPKTQTDLPIHGDERAVWSGKIACTDQSQTYVDQFKDLPGVVLLDHRQLLAFLADPKHEAHGALKKNAHIIIDDASMLEDTATKAYGHHPSMDDLRAGSEGNPALQKFTDLLVLWMERTRQYQDIRYITPNDLNTPEVNALRDMLSTLAKDELTPQLRRHLEAVQAFLNPERLDERITFIETRQNGSQYLESVPRSVGALLKEHLYDKYKVSLLIPLGSRDQLREILPPGVEASMKTPAELPWMSMPVEFPANVSLETLLENPPAGKTVILLSSRKSIEDAFVKYTEKLEDKGVTMICQNLSGGQERMQAEFLAATTPAVWLLTPWTYEGVELPEDVVDHVYVHTLPFDHPSQPVLSKRAEKYRDAFSEYSLPRLQHRLFRLMRTFSRHRTGGGNISILDTRMETKAYGKKLREYLSQFPGDEAAPEPKGEQMSLL